MTLDDIILKRGSDEYQNSRRRFINSATPDRYPHSIIHPRSAHDVSLAIRHDSKLDKYISVRSGGPLQTDEILVDMKNVNPRVEFDPKTHLNNFGPGQTVQDLQRYLTPRKLFFPTGHANSVGMGGFLTAGGQGYFNSGWGMTSDRWIVQIELVTADE